MTALERAFQMAGSGSVAKLSDLIRTLERQGYDGRQIHGPVLRRQLTTVIKTARSGNATSPEGACANGGAVVASAESEVHATP
ncbi:MAG: hypothetical protein WCF81_18855 [Roseiarcus sp.]